MEGLQCPKLLWYEYNNKEAFPPVDPLQQAIFDSGTKVGEVAQKLFPGGIKLEREQFPEAQSKKSTEALKLNKPLFEAGFVFNRGYALADILSPVKGGLWDLYEVKSSTEVKEIYCEDVAFQKYIYENAGVAIRKCFLIHINNEYVRRGPIDPKGLFVSEDITGKVEELQKEVPRKIKELLDLISWGDVPDMEIGPHCNSPYNCVLKDICWKSIPEKNSIFSLLRGKNKAFELAAQGICSLLDIPIDVKLSEKQYLQVECHKNSKVHIDRKAIEKFLKQLKYPLYFLDFETIGPAIPEYDNSKPFEQIPFQFSLHILKKEKAAPKHYSFLAEGRADPRPEILKSLKALLGSFGSILAYKADFEIGKIRSATLTNPQYEKWFQKIEERFVDLLAPFRGFAYYHPAQEGSNSMKKVLPAISGVSYDNLEIGNGSLASNEFYRVTFSPDIPQEERLRVRSALEEYCCLDTEGMITILKELIRRTNTG